MGVAAQGLQGLAGLASLVCFVMVLIAMFQRQQTILAIVCIVFCVIGPIIAFVYGWMKADEWNLKNVMLIWTIAVVIGFLGGGLSVVL
jgi:uncharacterized membrane protein YfcA